MVNVIKEFAQQILKEKRGLCALICKQMETSNRSFNKDLRRARSFRAQRDKSCSRNSSLANSRYVHCTLYTDVQYTYQVPLLLIQICSSAVPTIWHRFQSKNWRLSLYMLVLPLNLVSNFHFGSKGNFFLHNLACHRSIIIIRCRIFALSRCRNV